MVSFFLFFIGFFFFEKQNKLKGEREREKEGKRQGGWESAQSSLYFVCFEKILSQLEAASSVLPRIETFARCPRVVPSAAPRALRLGNALRFLCSVEPRTQLLILTYYDMGRYVWECDGKVEKEVYTE